MPSDEHETNLSYCLMELNNKGYKAVCLKKHPDGVALINNKLYAVEAKLYKNAPLHHKQEAIKRIRAKYFAFDGVVVIFSNGEPIFYPPIE